MAAGKLTWEELELSRTYMTETEFIPTRQPPYRATVIHQCGVKFTGRGMTEVEAKSRCLTDIKERRPDPSQDPADDATWIALKRVLPT